LHPVVIPLRALMQGLARYPSVMVKA
jgi:hypothetical protein